CPIKARRSETDELLPATGSERVMIVLKFGGTSVGNVERVRDAAAVVGGQGSARAGGVSAGGGGANPAPAGGGGGAPGEGEEAGGDGERAGEIAAAIRGKHLEIAAGIGDEAERTAALAELDQLHAALDEGLVAVAAAGSLSKRDSDRIGATGEKAMSVLMAA